MRPLHLSRLRIAGGDIEDLAHLHAEWALGLGRFAKLREGRLAGGVDPAAVPQSLVGSPASRWSLQLVVPEAGGCARTSAVVIEARADAVHVEHLIVRSGPVERLPGPSAAAPQVVWWMLDQLEVEPAALRQARTRRVDEGDVAGFVDDIASVAREVPLVVVAIDNALRTTLVDADALARRLAGMMTVHALASVRVSYRLRDELAARGFDEKLGCYNGGVRVLWPRLRPGDDPYDHLLLLPGRIAGMPEADRSERVAGIFAELVAEGEDPKRWLRAAERAGTEPVAAEGATARQPATKRTALPRASLAAVQPRPPIAQAAPGPARVADPAPREASVAEPVVPEPAPAEPVAPEPVAREPVASEPVASEPVASEPVAREPVAREPVASEPVAPAPASVVAPAPGSPRSTWAALAEEVAAGMQLAEEQERELDALRAELAELRKQLRRATAARDDLEGGLGPPRSVAGALQRAEALFGERLVVLRSARSSAADSGFRDPARVLFVLTLLAHCDHASVGEVITRALGGMARWKPKDSPETTRAFGKERTWIDHRGTPKAYGRHITVGHGVSPQKCLQIYYDVLDDGRVELAWCGEHRPTVGVDT